MAQSLTPPGGLGCPAQRGAGAHLPRAHRARSNPHQVPVAICPSGPPPGTLASPAGAPAQTVLPSTLTAKAVAECGLSQTARGPSCSVVVPKIFSPRPLGCASSDPSTRWRPVASREPGICLAPSLCFCSPFFHLLLLWDFNHAASAHPLAQLRAPRPRSHPHIHRGCDRNPS